MPVLLVLGVLAVTQIMPGLVAGAIQVLPVAVHAVHVTVAVRPGMLDMRARVGSVVVPVGSVVVPVAQVAAVTVVLAVITHTIVVLVSPHAVAIVAAVMVIADAVPVPVMGGRSAGGTCTGGTRA